MIDKRNWITQKIDTAKVLCYVRFFCKLNQSILITSYPKSGSTWLTDMIGLGLQIPRPKNRSVNFFTQYVLHGHYLHNTNRYKTIVLLRDPRDIFVSFYFYLLYENGISKNQTKQQVLNYANFQDIDDVSKNLPVFIEYLHSQYLKDGFTRFTFKQFVDSYQDISNVLTIKYEDILADTPAMLKKCFDFIGFELKTDIDYVIEAYNFNRMKEKLLESANDKSIVPFYRKGSAGDWKTHFTNEAAEVLNHYLGETMIRTGYVADLNWFSDNSTI